ncbi:hypothetical protein IMZ31_23680 (plasmid) [Pontibacillus sp. ALD_SL1]|uniref:hypothetical protein n=1 Tax=Pontibacillus sp. ALD_SL1 TaxID=2777185 RepID=UPI001A9649B5|nr:hypothetical protein [Pontibacillus sp. ALD_SL1]QST02453.1 hypothetical protein IMZ31_23680 [Pontibacillus sp. ALD_SL1]
MRHDKHIENVSHELQEVLRSEVEHLVDSHIENWGSRYEGKDVNGIGSISMDLYSGHDPSLEIERVEEALGRSLNGEEQEAVESYFNEHVLDRYRDPKGYDLRFTVEDGNLEDDYRITISEDQRHAMVENLSVSDSCAINLFETQEEEIKRAFDGKRWEDFICALIELDYLD